jgi:hypothetical protein
LVFYFIFVSVGIPRSTEKRDGLERAHVPELGADGAPSVRYAIFNYHIDHWKGRMYGEG